jgi:hypothetical protein
MVVDVEVELPSGDHHWYFVAGVPECQTTMTWANGSLNLSSFSSSAKRLELQSLFAPLPLASPPDGRTPLFVLRPSA